MKKLLLGGAVVLALVAASPAMAADLLVKAPVMAPPTYNWSGFYIGGNVGYSWGRAVQISPVRAQAR